MVGRTLHYISVVCCLFVLVSFGLFAYDQVSDASSHQASAIAPPTQTTITEGDAPFGIGNAPAAKAPSPSGPGQPRRFIDGVAHDLQSPFDGVVASSNAWVDHGVPALLALLVYGGGLGFLSRFASGRAGAGPQASPSTSNYV
jgi:hypothetical protein